jgi:hypothetical protein
LPIDKDLYLDTVTDPGRFCRWLDQSFRDHPEVFPGAFALGYRLKDDRVSARTGLRLRRIRLKATGQSFSVRPSFVLPPPDRPDRRRPRPPIPALLRRAVLGHRPRLR